MKILAFGEVLWDIFGDDYKIGGAPYNFCAHLAKLGAQSSLLSAVGQDDLRERTLAAIRRSCTDDSLTLTSDFPTGVCRVSCDAQGQPTYNLMQDTAYDHIALNEERMAYIRSVPFDAFYFGTLAQRGECSRNTLRTLLDTCRFGEIFCDLNLRQPFYSTQTILNCLQYATIFKISREECRTVAQTVLQGARPYEDTEEYYRDFCVRLSRQYSLKIVILTLDRDGAVVYNNLRDIFAVSEKPKSRAVSTVGAGDSFSACFLYNYFNGATLSECTSRAGILSDYVVTRTEAIPDYPENLIPQIR